MSVTSVTPMSGSIFGGFTINVTGGGFPTPLDAASRVLMWTSNGTSATWPMGMPVLHLLPSTGSTMTIYVDRVLPATPAAVAAAQGGSVNYQFTSMPPGTTPDIYWRFASFRSSITINYQKQWTLAVMSADFGGCATAGTACPVTVSYSLPTGTNAGLNRAPLGTAGTAVVEFQAAGGNVVRCDNSTVTANSVAHSSYNETLACTLPGSAAAGSYTLWVCWGTRGCGGAAGPTLAATIASVAPAAGSAGGGTNVTITGAGEPPLPTFAVVQLPRARLVCLLELPLFSAAGTSLPATPA
jgi:hypothetical protein